MNTKSQTPKSSVDDQIKKGRLISPVVRFMPESQTEDSEDFKKTGSMTSLKSDLTSPIKRHDTAKNTDDSENLKEEYVFPVTRLPSEDSPNNLNYKKGDCFTEKQFSYSPDQSIKPLAENAKVTHHNELTNMQRYKQHIFSFESFYYKENKMFAISENSREFNIGNFWFNILAEERYISSCDAETISKHIKFRHIKWRVEIYCCGERFQALMSKEDLQDIRCLCQVTNQRAFLEESLTAKRMYNKFVQKQIEKGGNVLYVYDTTGWNKILDGSFKYVISDGIIGYLGESNCRSNSSYRLEYDKSLSGNSRNFLNVLQLRNLCYKKNANSIFLFHFMLLSVLSSLYRESGFPVDFITAVIGTTNSQKTATAMIFSRIFNRTSTQKADYRFDATITAIQEGMEKYGDGILFIDDFVPYDNLYEKRVQQQKLEALARGYGDGVPKKRSKLYAKVNDVSEYTKIHGCCLITGELISTNSLSTNTRIIQLFFEKGEVDLNLLTYFQENLLNVPTFLYDFIFYIQNNIPQTINIIKQEIYKSRVEQYSGITIPRYKTTFGIMKSIISIFYNYAYNCNAMDFSRAKEMHDIDIIAIESIIKSNEKQCLIVSPATNICNALKWSIQNHKIKVVDFSAISNDLDCYDYIIKKGDFLCILPDRLFLLYQNFCKQQNKLMSYESARDLTKPMETQNLLLIKEESGKKRRTHKIGNLCRKRFFYINIQRYENICDNYDSF